MVKKTDLDIRGNWLFYDNALLTIDKYSPLDFQGILTIGREAIKAAAEAQYTKTVDNSPSTARVHYPWMYAIMLAGTDDTFTKALTPEAELITSETHSNDGYSREHIRPHLFPYLDAAVNADFEPRVPGPVYGYRDGLWLMIKTFEHYGLDYPLEQTHDSVPGSSRWQTKQEVADNYIPKD